MLRAMGWGGSPTFAGLTLTGQLLASDGTVSAPSISFANQTNTGMWRRADGVLAFSTRGVDQLEIIDVGYQAGGIRLHSANKLSWTASGDASNTEDLYLQRDAAGTLAQRNGTNAQTVRLYETYTDALNYSRFEIRAGSGGQHGFVSASAGTGLLRDFVIGSNGFASGWSIDLSNQVDFFPVGGAKRVGRPANPVAHVIVSAPTTYTALTYAVIGSDNHIIANSTAASTITLPTPASNTGRTLFIKTVAAFTVASASANVVPLAGGAAGAAILAATAGKYAVLVCDGTNWVTMDAN